MNAQLHRIVQHRDHRKVIFTNSNLRRWRRTSITAVLRRGKVLAITTARGSLIVGAGMSGHWRWTPATEPCEAVKHDIFSIEASTGTATFNDARRFGSARILPPGDSSWADHLGLEGTNARAMSNPVMIQAAFDRRANSEIKPALLDQTLITGLGNIYAAEVLWWLRLHPFTRVHEIKPPVWRHLGPTVHRVLTAAIRGRGTTIAGANPYRTPTNEPTNGYLCNVYGRAGLPCPRCRAPIVQVTQAGRSTFYCDRCQI